MRYKSILAVFAGLTLLGMSVAGHQTSTHVQMTEAVQVQTSDFL